MVKNYNHYSAFRDVGTIGRTPWSINHCILVRLFICSLYNRVCCSNIKDMQERIPFYGKVQYQGLSSQTLIKLRTSLTRSRTSPNKS